MENIPSPKPKPELTLEQAMEKAASSVKELIPGISTEGLTLKGSENSEKKWENWIDVNKNVNHKDIFDLDTPYARNLYTYELDDEKLKKLNDKAIADYYENREGDQKLRDEIRGVFMDQVVVDLGAGNNHAGYMIADQAGAKAYVGVEPDNAGWLLDSITRALNPELGESDIEVGPLDGIKKIPFSVVQDDMLSFLKRLPDNSVSIFCGGIDYNVIQDNKYRSEVAKEIKRVLSPQGGYVGQAGGMSIDLPDSPDVEKMEVHSKKDIGFTGLNLAFIYRKI